MLYDPRYAKHHDELGDTLHTATAMTPALMSKVVSQACVRLHAQGAAAKAKLNRLIEAGAWTDAALALLELELRQWTVRRLACEDGEWLCTLSRQPGLPIELDEVVQSSHPCLPLAILAALLEARHRAAAGTPRPTTAVPPIRSTADYAVCCDNFS